jgi:hypothetical protein
LVLQPSSAEKDQTINLLKARQNQYKIAALACKRSGDIAQAKQFLVVSKVCESFIYILNVLPELVF